MKNLNKLLLLRLSLVLFLSSSLFGFDASKLKCDKVIEHTDYSVCYDYELKSAIAGYAVLNGKKTIKSIKNRPWYHSEKKLESQFRHYKRIKRNPLFENGHTIVADADVDYEWYALKEAYSLANITPMYKNFNRRVWSKVETRGRYLAQELDTVYSITLIKYDNNNTYNGWAIPSKYFRIYETKYFNECYAYEHKRYTHNEFKKDRLIQHKICCEKLLK